MNIEIKEGDVILIGGSNPMWINCLMRVEEVRTWGVIGSVLGPNQSEYPMRVGNEEILCAYRKLTP